MEPIGFTLGVIPELRHQVQSMITRIDKFKKGPETYQGLKTELENMATLIAEIEGAQKLNPKAMSEVSLPWFSSKLKKVQKYLQETYPIMEKLWHMEFPGGSSEQPKREKLKASYQRLTQANANDKELLAVEERVRDASRVLDLLTAELSILIRVDDLSTMVAAGSAESKYTPEGSTPALPHTVSLNFNVKDAEGKPATPEAYLKHYVLAEATEVIAAAGVMNPAYGVVGIAGVGKTVALQGLAFDEDITKHFSDGIHYISLGKGATVQTVVSEIANIMRITGANAILDSVEKSSSVREAVNKAETWFRGRTSLFLVDDLWPTSDKTGYLHDLRQLLRRSPASRMVITTRSNDIAQKAGSIVDFDARDPTGAVSEGIFMSYAMPHGTADVSSQIGSDVKSSVAKVLLLCGGLPIALSVAGCAVAKLAKLHETFRAACDDYEIQLRKTKASLREKPGFNGISLNAGILLSLQCLEPEYEKWKEDYGVDTKHTIIDLYVGLCVLRNQGWIPVSVLSRLWNLGEMEALRIANFFCEMSLATLKRREHNAEGVVEGQTRSEVGVKLRDLHLDFCQQYARKSKRVVDWHSELLAGYCKAGDTCGLPFCGDSGDIEEQILCGLSTRSWWLDDVPRDGYIYDNLARHLVCADRIVELGTLLLDARWTHLRMKVGGLVALGDDFESFGCFPGSTTGGKKGWSLSKGFYESFALLFRALQQSWGRISEGQREVQFQMCGRLVMLKKDNAVVNKYVESLLTYTEKPYLVPVTPFFPDVRSGELLDVQVGDDCADICCSPCGRFIAANISGDVVVLDSFSGVILRRLDQSHSVRQGGNLQLVLWSDRRIAFSPNSKTIAVASDADAIMLCTWESCQSSIQFLEGHKGFVTCVAISVDGERVYSGSVDGTVRVWDITTGAAAGAYQVSAGVRCLALSADGQKMAFGLAGGMLKVLDSCTRAVVFEERMSDGHEVKSVAFCANGLYLVAGSTVIHAWSTQTWALEKDMTMESVDRIAFSPNGEHFVTVSSDDVVRTWNVETWALVGALSNLHNSVSSVAFGGDGRRVILGFKNGSVRVWDSQFSRHSEGASRDHSTTAWNVAISRDGLRVASVFIDGSVGIWDSRTGAHIGKLVQSDRSGARCVSFSPDERRLVSGHWDGVLQLWDLQTWARIGDPVKGHTDAVRNVAYSFDGLRIVSVSQDRLVWDAVSLMPIGDIFKGCGNVRGVAKSADGLYIVANQGAGNRVCIRSRTSGKIVWTFKKKLTLENGDAGKGSEEIENENEIGDIEAVQIIRSCINQTPLLWSPELPRHGEVYVRGAQMYSDILGKTVLLGSIPGARKPVDWKYNARRRVFAAGLGFGGEGVPAICTAVFD